jgi:hypothetical protein
MLVYDFPFSAYIKFELLSTWHTTSASLQNLNYLCKDSESIEILGKIQDQVDVLQQSTELVSSSAEVSPSVIAVKTWNPK